MTHESKSLNSVKKLVYQVRASIDGLRGQERSDLRTVVEIC